MIIAPIRSTVIKPAYTETTITAAVQPEHSSFDMILKIYVTEHMKMNATRMLSLLLNEDR